MAKKIIAALLCAVAVLAVVSCGKKVECDFCGETKNGTVKNVFGEKVSVCNDCIDELSDF